MGPQLYIYIYIYIYIQEARVPRLKYRCKAEAGMILVFAFMNFKSKLKDAFTILNSFRRSTDFNKGIHSFYPKI